QETQVARELSVTENLLMEQLPRRRGLVDWSRAHAEAGRRLREVGLSLDPRLSMARLRPVEVKRVEIARALSADARVLVLDEPTAVLPRTDAQRLFELIRALRDRGVAVVYISHHLKETLDVADAVTVLRDGRLVATEPAASLTTARLVSLMLGEHRDAVATAARRKPGGAGSGGALAVDARALACAPMLDGVDLTVRAGEIVCLTGLADSGRKELARCLVGAERPTGGTLQVGGRTPTSPRAAVRSGTVFLPEDRKAQALFLERSVLENAEIGPLAASRSPWFRPRASAAASRKLLRRLRVKAASDSVAIRTLSGGNQQKVVLARWLGTGASVFVFDEPTAGIDVGAKAEIYDVILDLARDGAAVVVFSSDFDEIRALADRVLVLKRGRVAGELAAGELDDEQLLSLEAA
ncbi:MAG TPA: sugar ABC transporter ATP-binding protein, partial [Solirubrobacteraceae bacterium]